MYTCTVCIPRYMYQVHDDDVCAAYSSLTSSSIPCPAQEAGMSTLTDIFEICTHLDPVARTQEQD